MDKWSFKKYKKPSKNHKTETKRLITNNNMCRQSSVWPSYFFYHTHSSLFFKYLWSFYFYIIDKSFLIRKVTFQNEDFLGAIIYLYMYRQRPDTSIVNTHYRTWYALNIITYPDRPLIVYTSNCHHICTWLCYNYVGVTRFSTIRYYSR